MKSGIVIVCTQNNYLQGVLLELLHGAKHILFRLRRMEQPLNQAASGYSGSADGRPRILVLLLFAE